MARAGDIVQAAVVEAGQRGQVIQRDAAVTGFIVAVGALGDPDPGCDAGLREVVLFPQTAESFMTGHDTVPFR